ncbi:MAG TPA: sigma 54-interacting transcriptional regulator [Candidatus Avidesulfovibrio excrementigallinarum]|nr:sigma 54-interacting transcriptional regulator [Candidatus Avidesulfovibrio excrementigallinarum]
MNEQLLSHLGDTLPDVCSMLNIAIMNLPTGLFICDTNGIIVFINKAYASYLNTDPAQAVGKHITEFIPDSRILRVLQTGEPDIGAIRFIAETSSRILTNRYPLHDAQGRLIGAMSMVVLDNPEQLHILQRQIDSLGRKVNSYARRIKVALEARYTVDSIVGSSPVMLEFKQLLLRFARTDGTVLINGQTGTGKELTASAIHNASSRSDGPYVSINCAAIPLELFESELFGYAPGSFSGASKDGKTGQIELADEGTLFLDEVGDLPLGAQVKLLRVIEERAVRRVGDNTPHPVNFRLVTATNRDLSKMVANGTFREDLYYRINSMVLTLPPLKERREDIPALVDHMLERQGGVHCSPEVMDILQRYSWPGNIRELKNVLFHAMSLVEGDTITVKELPSSLLADIAMQNGGTTHAERLEAIRGSSERAAILSALRENRWNVSRAAQSLGISRANIYEKMRKFGIQRSIK